MIKDLRTSQAGNIIPSGRTSVSGYLLCDGSAVSRTTYADLFAAIGTTFGVGDGSTTFNIPDLVGAVPRGAGTSVGYTQNVTVALGAKSNDQMQQITGNINSSGVGLFLAPSVNLTPTGALSVSTFTAPTANATNTGTGRPRNLTIDSANSPGARTGNETKTKDVGVNFFIKF